MLNHENLLDLWVRDFFCFSTMSEMFFQSEKPELIQWSLSSVAYFHCSLCEGTSRSAAIEVPKYASSQQPIKGWSRRPIRDADSRNNHILSCLWLSLWYTKYISLLTCYHEHWNLGGELCRIFAEYQLVATRWNTDLVIVDSRCRRKKVLKNKIPYFLLSIMHLSYVQL